jgi:hypothetical protein
MIHPLDRHVFAGMPHLGPDYTRRNIAPRSHRRAAPVLAALSSVEALATFDRRGRFKSMLITRTARAAFEAM